MTDELKYDSLNASIDRIVASGDFVSTGDEDVDALGRIATGLRGLPGPDFRTRLRTEIAARSGRDSPSVAADWAAGVPGASWLGGQGLFLAGGSSFGLVGGACCLSGAIAYASGLSGAAAATAFIHSTIPYFIALSIVSMVAWLGWLLREQGITPFTVGRMVRQHGAALAGSYAAVFAATMSLSIAMCLY